MKRIPTEALLGALDAVPLVLMLVDGGGQVVYVNRAARASLGVAEPVGTPVGTYLYSPDGRTTWETVKARLVESGSATGRVNLACADGSEVECELEGVALGLSGSGQLYALTFRDITETLRHERHIEDKNIQMARMNAELLRSNADLHRVSELKSKFLSIASHELKTPLTLVKGYADIIVETMQAKVAPDAYDMVRGIDRAADRLDGVVNSILDATRLERGRLRLNEEDMDLAAVLRRCAREFDGLGQRRGITFTCEIADGLPPFYGDRQRMEQVIGNLLSNALKYSPDNATVTVRLRLDGPDHVLMVVEDRGVGVPPEAQPRLFQPFYEVARATRHSTDPVKFQGGGVGLGLFVARGIVEQHGGAIWVESEGSREGSYPGSRFYVRVPLRTAPQPEQTKEPEGEEPACGPVLDTAPGRGGGSVLVADTDPEAAEAVRMALEGRFDVVWVDNGGAAVARALECQPSVVLLERNLPVLDGLRLCRVLRAQDETAGAAIAFFSSWSDEATVRRCFECGADDYLIKPVDAAELQDRVSRLLARKRARDAAPGVGPDDL